MPSHSAAVPCIPLHYIALHGVPTPLLSNARTKAFYKDYNNKYVYCYSIEIHSSKGVRAPTPLHSIARTTAFYKDYTKIYFYCYSTEINSSKGVGAPTPLHSNASTIAFYKDYINIIFIAIVLALY